MSKHGRQADSFIAWAKKQGLRTSRKIAQTTTEYVTVWKESDCEESDCQCPACRSQLEDLVVRFADHGDCYETSFASVSPDALTLAQAKAKVKEFFRQPR